MAVKKRRDGPLVAYAVSADDAIDQVRTPLLDYIRTRDAELVHAVPGRQLTRWTLRPLTAPQAAYCASYDAPQNYQLAFAVACQDCSDVALGLQWDGSGADRQVTSASLSGIPDQVWIELGKLALDMGRLSLGEAPRFALPPGLRAMATPPSATTATSVPASDAHIGPKG